jgi:hypothetical protein
LVSGGAVRRRGTGNRSRRRKRRKREERRQGSQGEGLTTLVKKRKKEGRTSVRISMMGEKS